MFLSVPGGYVSHLQCVMFKSKKSKNKSVYSTQTETMMLGEILNTITRHETCVVKVLMTPNCN